MSSEKYNHSNKEFQGIERFWEACQIRERKRSEPNFFFQRKREKIPKIYYIIFY
jgi:hypothetical protein